eukprot:gene30252-35240_t
MAVPAVCEVILVASLFYFIFAVLAVNLLMGQLFYCADEQGNIIDPYYVVSEGNINKSWCEDGVHVITHSEYHAELGVDVPAWDVMTNWQADLFRFDNVLMALWVLYSMASLEGWSEVSLAAMDASGVDEQPARMANAYIGIFFIVFIIFCAFFILNLVIGVSINKFNELKKSRGGVSALMTEQQTQWLTIQRLTPNQTKPSTSTYNPSLCPGVSINKFNELKKSRGGVSVSINKFNELKKSRGGVSVLMTEQQTQWLTIQRLMANTSPRRKYTVPSNWIRKCAFSIMFSRAFDWFMITAILLNILTMFMVHEGMSSKWEESLKAANAAFTAIFLLEMMIKFTGIGIPAYFKERWNQFDFVVVVISVVGVIVDYVASSDLAFMALLRVLRVLRIIKLVPKAKGLRMMLETLYWSLPALGNVATVLLLWVYIYAIIGMNLFGAIKLQESLNRHVNFQDFPTSVLTLLSIITGENWPTVQTDCMIKEDCWMVRESSFVGDPFNVSLPSGTYLDPVDDRDLLDALSNEQKENRCSPAPILSIFYFCSYMMVVVYLLLQLVIAVILENIELHANMENMEISNKHILAFVEKWEELDDTGTGYIEAPSITALLMAIPPPVGIQGKDRIIMRVQNILLEADIPYRSNQLHFLETLHALTGRIAGAELPVEEEYIVHNRLVQRLPKDEEPPKYSIADFYCAMQVKTSIKGFLIRLKILASVQALAREQSEAVSSGKLGSTGGLNKFSSMTRLDLDNMIFGNKAFNSKVAKMSPPPRVFEEQANTSKSGVFSFRFPPSPVVVEGEPNRPARRKSGAFSLRFSPKNKVVPVEGDSMPTTPVRGPLAEGVLPPAGSQKMNRVVPITDGGPLAEGVLPPAGSLRVNRVVPIPDAMKMEGGCMHGLGGSATRQVVVPVDSGRIAGQLLFRYCSTARQLLFRYIALVLIDHYSTARQLRYR